VTNAASTDQQFSEVPNKFGVLREDTKTILGVVSGKYRLYQNSDMWNFIDTYVKSSGMKLETAGSLRGGQYTWALLKGEEFEVVKGDPINKYFLFRNSFTGAVPVSTLFTNIRVVCNNTLTLALNSAKHIHNVRHVGDVVSQVAEVEKALAIQKSYQSKTYDTLKLLTHKSMPESTMRSFLEDKVFTLNVAPPPLSNKVINIDTLKQRELIEKQRILKIKRDKKVSQVLDLVDTGAGSDIVGVKGTAYGLFQAIVEWADHDKMTRSSLHTINTTKFESAMFTSTAFKTNVLEHILKAA
jgi:phage/plasmid-like protein (TIGR03299 family)